MSEANVKEVQNIGNNSTQAGRVNPYVLGFYMLLHLGMCNAYFWVFLLSGWLALYLFLGGLIFFSSLWASRETRQRHFPFPSAGVLLGCTLIWPLAFPLYLTYRQRIKMREGRGLFHQRPHH
jgi:hypothetical protein